MKRHMVVGTTIALVLTACGERPLPGHLMVAGQATQATLDNTSAPRIDIRANLNFEPDRRPGRARQRIRSLNSWDHVRFIEMQDAEGGTIVMVAGANNQAHFDEVLPLIEPVIAPIDF